MTFKGGDPNNKANWTRSMADFTPPPLSSHEGPASFMPPPLSSHEGPAKIPGMERLGALPGVGSNPITGNAASVAPIPGKLDNVTKDPHPRGLLRRTYDGDVDALASVVGGGSRATHAKNEDEFAGAANDAFDGAMTLAEPLLAAGLALAPVATLAALATGTGGGKLAKTAMKASGATDNEAEFIGNLASFGTGTLAAKTITPKSVAAMGDTLAIGRGGMLGSLGEVPGALKQAMFDIPGVRKSAAYWRGFRQGREPSAAEFGGAISGHIRNPTRYD